MNLDDTGRIPPPRPPHSADRPSSTAASRRIFPGFLAPADREDEDSYIGHGMNASPTSPSSPSTLPYLQHPPASTRPPHHESPRKPPPSPLHLDAPTGHLADGQAPRQSPAPSSAGPSTGRGSLGSAKPRPKPLELDATRGVIGLDEELSAQREHAGPMTAISAVQADSPDSLRDQMNDLSLLRQSVQRNLIARPVDSPLTASSGGSSDGLTPDLLPFSLGQLPGGEAISIDTAVDLLASATSAPQSARQTLVLDTRPLGDFLSSHLPRSANLSIPSLIFKRFRKAGGANAASWNSLGSFVSTPASKAVWESIDPAQPVEVIVVGLTTMDEPARILRGVLASIMKGNVRILRGGWAAVLSSRTAVGMLVQGEQSVKASDMAPRSAPVYEPPPIPSTDPVPRIARRPSAPTLRFPPGGKRNLPSLYVNGNNAASSRRPPKLSLNLDQSLRSATFASSQSQQDLEPPNLRGLAVPGQSRHQPASSDSGQESPRLSTSLQALCHQQSKLPPSPSSFGGMDRQLGYDRSPTGTPSTSQLTARPGNISEQSSNAWESTSGNVSATPRGGGMAPFVVSTILPSFLFLGPEISSNEDVEVLQRLGVKRILNVAIECDDHGDLRLKERFEKYMKVPMRDIVEESGVAKGMRDSCEFLDDARLHSAPTYVHCKAGKSRSVTVVLAYLIHANAWTLKTSYAYVAERRKGISPNIGFVAELMQFEENELGLKQSGGVHGESGQGESHSTRDEGRDDQRGGHKQRPAPRHMRESLPPAWAASLDSGPRPPKAPLSGNDEGEREEEERRKAVGDEREVRKNGQWVHHRRAPVDRTTLQPGRRVSKAGLESLRSLSSANTPRSSPSPSPRLTDGGDKATTPGGEGRLGWV